MRFVIRKSGATDSLPWKLYDRGTTVFEAISFAYCTEELNYLGRAADSASEYELNHIRKPQITYVYEE